MDLLPDTRLVWTRQRQYLISAHAGIGSPFQRAYDKCSAPVFAPLRFRLANAGMIAGQLKLYFRMRQEAQAIADFLRNCDLAFTGNLRSITPTGKNSAAVSAGATLRLAPVLFRN